MIEKFIAIYVFIDDILIEIGHKEPVSRNTSDSEIITVALIAAKYFHGNIFGRTNNFANLTFQKAGNSL
jgi:hypothetical protein